VEVRDLPIGGPLEQARNTSGNVAPASAFSGPLPALSAPGLASTDTNFQPMETPLVMSGFQPQAIRLWQQKMAGTGLDMVAAGGLGGSSKPADESTMASADDVLPGSAVSLQLVRGDLEIAATCTVTYIDPKQLLACGHPVLQAGPISLPMTKAEIVTTLASSLQSFKVVNT